MGFFVLFFIAPLIARSFSRLVNNIADGVTDFKEVKLLTKTIYSATL